MTLLHSDFRGATKSDSMNSSIKSQENTSVPTRPTAHACNNLDTLAQLPQGAPTKGCSAAILRKKAKSKYHTRGFVSHLLRVDSPLKRQYWRAYDCADNVRVEDGKTRTHYCNSRACNTCNRIRTANAISGYRPHFENCLSAMLTLTDDTKNSKTISEGKRAARKRVKDWYNIRKMLLRKGISPDGLTKLEVTYTLDKYYHPHLHIILKVEGYDRAQLDELCELIIWEWLKRNPTAKRVGQHFQATTETDKSLRELLKYTTKQGKKEEKNAKKYEIDPVGLDGCLQILHGKRTLMPFGNIRKVTEEVEEIELVSEPVEKADGLYVWNVHDWYHIDTGEALTGYEDPRISFELIETQRLII